MIHNLHLQARLDQNEQYQKMLATVEQLEKEKAETTVDTYIQKGVILPKQRETALKLCINDPETFSDLYRDAKPIVETHPKHSFWDIIFIPTKSVLYPRELK